MAMTIMPTPPSHCSKARQIRMPGEAVSICCRTVDPVVVMPETDSKTASVRLSCNSLKIKGRAPKRPISIQEPLVSRNAWRNPRSKPSRCDVASQTETPTKAVSSADRAKTCQSGDPKYKSKHIGISIAAARIVVSKPRMFRTGESTISNPPVSVVDAGSYNIRSGSHDFSANKSAATQVTSHQAAWRAAKDYLPRINLSGCTLNLRKEAGPHVGIAFKGTRKA